MLAKIKIHRVDKLEPFMSSINVLYKTDKYINFLWPRAFCSWPMSHPVCYGLGNVVDHRVEHRAGQCNPGNAIVWVGGGEVGRCKVEHCIGCTQYTAHTNLRTTAMHCTCVRTEFQNGSNPITRFLKCFSQNSNKRFTNLSVVIKLKNPVL